MLVFGPSGPQSKPLGNTSTSLCLISECTKESCLRSSRHSDQGQFDPIKLLDASSHVTNKCDNRSL